MTETLNNFHDRLAKALQLRRIGNSELARMTEVNPSTVGRWLEGTTPQPAVMKRIAKALQVQPQWLLNGLGEMEVDPLDMKEDPKIARLEEPSVMFRSRRIPTSANPPPQASIAHRTDDQLCEVLVAALERFKQETEPLLKRGYLHAMRTVMDDLERRLGE